MYLTMQSAYREVANVNERHVGKLSGAIAEGALKGARGNSGVILSQLWAGVAKALDGHEKLTAELLAEAARMAVDSAYRAVEKPVEGTILTVSREMMEAVDTRYQTMPDLVLLLKRMVFAGRASLRRTPDMLPVLKKAGVVDSGGQGLVFIFEGMLRALCGKMFEASVVESMIVIPEAAKTGNWQTALEPEDLEGYGYDVQFLMRGVNLSADKVRSQLIAMGGWSTIVVGDNNLLKVHVHVHDPGEPISYAIKSGASIDDVVVENMQRQYEDYVQERLDRETEIRTDVQGVAVITVANGKGMHRVFSELGAAYVISGGQTMNPSTGDFLEAINALPNEEIILLPNNKNIVLSAQQAVAKAVDKKVALVPSITLPQGISALFEYSNLCQPPDCSLHDVTTGMTDALDNVITCEVTTATRNVTLDEVSVRAGEYIGLLNDDLVVAGETLETVTFQLLERAKADKHERITVYYGIDIHESQASALVEHLSEHFPKQDFEVINGGQALYPYIISIE